MNFYFQLGLCTFVQKGLKSHCIFVHSPILYILNLGVISPFLINSCPLLADKELEELGVKTMGDRAVFRSREAERSML